MSVQGSTLIYLCLSTRLMAVIQYQEQLNTDTNLCEKCLYRHQYNIDLIIGGTLLFNIQHFESSNKAIQKKLEKSFFSRQ